MEQDKIDVSGATPVPLIPRRGAPMWLQLLLSLIVIVAAAALAGLLVPSANTMLASYGVNLPLLTDSAPAAPPGQAAPQVAQGQAPAQGQSGGRPQGGQGSGSGGGGRGSRTAVVVAAPVVVATINDKLTAIGEGSAIHSVTVSSVSAGTLLDVSVKPGQRVEAGAELAHLDAGTQQVALERAQLAARDADAALARANELAKANSLSNVQLSAAQLTADTAKLELRNADLALAQRTITTPISGTVGLIQVSPGNQVNAQTVVTTIEDASEILINFWVPERYASQIATGMPVAATSVALPGKTFTGMVSAVDNRIDSASRTLQVQASLPNPDGIIRSGMSFSVAMTFDGETFPAVDPLSIQWSNDGAYVWKIVDGKVQKGMVEIIQRNSDGVLVRGDVAEGDSVVTQGVLQLSDGASVRLLDAPQGNAAGAPAAADGQSGQRPAGSGKPGASSSQSG